MNFINKLSLLILFVNVPAYQGYLKHHSHCDLSSSWSVNLSSLRVAPNASGLDSATIVEPMRLTKQDGNVTLVALLDAS